MDTKYLSFYDCSDRQVIKGIIKIVPDIVISIFLCYFFIKAVNVGNVSGFMISSQKYNLLGIFYFVEEK